MTMIKNVILDTCFLIHLFSENQTDQHRSAKKYFKYFSDHDIVMYVPSIVVSEFQTKQSLRPLLDKVKILNFNYPDACITGELHIDYYEKVDGVKRDNIKDDFKIIASSKLHKIDAIITFDYKSMKKFCKAIQKDDIKLIDVYTDGYDESLITGSKQPHFLLDDI